MENQIKVYKVFQSLDLDSQEYVAKSAQLINKLNSDSAALSAIIADITSDRLGVRRGSCYLLGRLLEETGNNKLNISASHRSDIITGMVSSLSSSTDCQEASQLLWSLKRDILVSSDEMTPHVLPTLQACQHAVSDIKSSIANRPSYAVAAGALQLIAKFYKVQPDIMKANSRIWFSLVLPYCAHVSKQLRLCSQNIIEMSYDHLVAHAHIVREIVSDVAGVVIANITNIINKYYDEASKIFAIKFWGLLILIMADKLENISTTNLFMSALTKAFSKNYSEIQAAAFEAWKLLINTFSVEYLLRPQLLKPLIIPLTKSNRSDDMLSLKARFNCWWLLIRRMDSSIQQHFTEVCKPLLEFCLADNSSSALPPPGLKSRNMTEKSLVKNSRSPLLINHLVAVTLQFLGQCDPPYMEEIQLGATQGDIELTKPILKHCAKVLFQSLDESIKYLKAHSTADSKGDMMNLLLKCFSRLVKHTVELSEEELSDNQLLRELIKMAVSIAIRHKHHSSLDFVLQLVMPLTDFSVNILSSAVYTPSEINSIMKNPAVCLLEVLWCSLKKEQSSAISSSRGVKSSYQGEELSSRLGECIGQLVTKGCHPTWSTALMLTYTNNVLEVVQMESSIPANASSFLPLIVKCLATAVKPSISQAATSLDVEPFVPIYRALVSRFSPTVVMSFLKSASNDLLKLFQLDNPQVLSIWRTVSDNLQMLEERLTPPFLHLIEPLLSLTLQHPNSAFRKTTVLLWTNSLFKYASDDMRHAFGSVIEKKRAELNWSPKVTGLPPSGSTNSPLIAKNLSSWKPVTPLSSRKLVKSPKSPLRTVSRRQLISTSPCKPTIKVISSKVVSPESRTAMHSSSTRSRVSPAGRKRSIEVADSPSQTIDSSPESSQVISQCEEDRPESATSLQISDEMDSSISKSTYQQPHAADTTPKQSKRRLLVDTPGYPVSSPLAFEEIFQVQPATPLALTSESDCSQKSVQYQLRSCSVLLTNNIAVTPGSDLDSQGSLPSTGTRQRKPSRKSKAMNKLNLSEVSSGSSQSQQSSQSSETGSQRKSRKKRIDNNACASLAFLAEYTSSVSRSVRVKMVSNTGIRLIKLNGVKVIKSKKSKVIRSGDDFCESQETQELCDGSVAFELHSDGGSSLETQKEDNPVPTTSSADCKSPMPDDLLTAESCSSEDICRELHHSDITIDSGQTRTVTPSQESLSDALLSTDSLFSDEALSTPPDLEANSCAVNENSLQFATLSGSSMTSSSVITPIPPRISITNDAAGNLLSSNRLSKTSEENSDRYESQADNFGEKSSTFVLGTIGKMSLLKNSKTLSSQERKEDYFSGKGSDDHKINSDDVQREIIASPPSNTVKDNELIGDVGSVKNLHSSANDEVGNSLVPTAASNDKSNFLSDTEMEVLHVNSQPTIVNTSDVDTKQPGKNITLPHNSRESLFDESSTVCTSSGSIPPSDVLDSVHPPDKTSEQLVESQVDAVDIDSQEKENDSAKPFECHDNSNSEISKQCEELAERSKLVVCETNSTLKVHDQLPNQKTITASPTEAKSISSPNSTPKTRPPKQMIKSNTDNKPTPSPSRAQKMLLLSSRSSQILARSKSSKANSHSTGNSGHLNPVETLSVTPRSHKLNIEALELDCTPIHSPTTGSILKRRNLGSPADGSSSKKVKFTIPDGAKEKSSSARKFKQLSKVSRNQALLSMYSSTEQCQSSPEISQKGSFDSSQSQNLADELPIAGEYTNSTVSISEMICHLTTPVWHGNLRQCLASQGITTIGEMAKLTESEVNLLPIKQPKLSTALKAFGKCGAVKNRSSQCYRIANGTDTDLANEERTCSAPMLPPPPSPKSAIQSTDHLNKSAELSPSQSQLKTIMSLVTDQNLSDAQLGSKIRLLLTENCDT